MHSTIVMFFSFGYQITSEPLLFYTEYNQSHVTHQSTILAHNNYGILHRDYKFPYINLLSFDQLALHFIKLPD